MHSHLNLKKQESGKEKKEDGQMSTPTEVIVLVTTHSLPKIVRQAVHQFFMISAVVCGWLQEKDKE